MLIHVDRRGEPIERSTTFCARRLGARIVEDVVVDDVARVFKQDVTCVELQFAMLAFTSGGMTEFVQPRSGIRVSGAGSGTRQPWGLHDVSVLAPNLSTAVGLTGDIDSFALNRSPGAVVIRHEALRTRFEKRGADVPCSVVTSADPCLRVLDRSAVRTTESTATIDGGRRQGGER